MSARVRYVVRSPDGAYRGEHRGAVIGFGWVTDPLAAAFMSKTDAAGCVAHMNRIAQPEHRGYAVERIEVPLIEQTARVRDAESELTRLRAALQAIADRQPTQHVGDAHRGTMHDDRKSAYYVGVFDGRKDGLLEAADMARAALVTT